MIEFKQDDVARVPVRLVDVSGNGVAGVLFSAVTVTVEKSDGTISPVSIGAPDWVEVTTGAFSGTGKYTLLLPNTETDLHGVLTYAVSTAGAVTYVGAVKVVGAEARDLRRIAEGRWAMFTSGPDANRLVLYDNDGVTPIQKWDLKDDTGTPTTGPSIFERVPTEPIP